MNFLDIILITINGGIIIFGIISIIFAIKTKNDWYSDWTMICCIVWFMYLFIGWMLWLPFLTIDKSSGQTIGTITSVDKNFFGTTAIYIRTTQNNEEKHCIEFDEELEEKANTLIGKEVIVKYGTRVGLYSTGKCSEAPIEYIEEVK